MEIKVKLVYGTFMFLDDLSISRDAGAVTIDISKKNDNFIRTLALSIGCGKLKSDKTQEEVLSLIGSERLKYQTSLELGLDPETPKINDTITAPVEILEVVEEVVEETKDEAEVIDAPTEEELPTEVDLPELNLKDLLKGSTRTVVSKIKSSELTVEQTEALLKLEEKGKNRSAIKSVIKEA